MDFLYVILTILTVVGIFFGGYYLLALVLLWPRLLAKYLLREQKDVSRIRKKTTNLIILELFLFLASFLLSYFYSPKFFESILHLSLIAGGGLLAFEIFVYDLFPRAMGLTLVGPPPRFLLREVKDLWVHRFIWVPAIAIFLALFIASHAVGMLALILGIIMAIRFKEFIRRDEDKDQLAYYIGNLRDEKQRSRILSVIMLGDIGGAKAVQSLTRLLGHRPYLMEHSFAVESLGKIGDPRAVTSLLSVLSQEASETFRDRVITALAEIARTDAEQLVTALKNEHPDIRRGAAEALEKSGWKPKG